MPEHLEQGRHRQESEKISLEAPRLKDLDPRNRPSLIRVATDGIEVKYPKNSKMETVSEEELIREFQHWQKEALRFLHSPEGAAFAATRGPFAPMEFVKDLEGIIFFGEKELLAGAERLADHSMDLMHQGKSVTYALLRPGGASNEYVLLHVLEALQRKGVDPEMLQVIHRRWATEKERSSLSFFHHTFESFAQDAPTEDHVLITLDDWRISGAQIQSELSETERLARKFLSLHPSRRVEREVQFLFEASNRVIQDDLAHRPGVEGYRVTPAFSGSWLGPHRQPISGVWTLVDFGFHTRRDFRVMSEAMGMPLPGAFKIIRPTEPVPPSYDAGPIVYKNEDLRWRSLETFHRWCGRDREIPDQTLDLARAFDRGKTSEDWKSMQVRTADEAMALFSGVRENRGLVFQLGLELSSEITRTRSAIPLELQPVNNRASSSDLLPVMDNLLLKRISEVSAAGGRLHEYDLFLMHDLLARQILEEREHLPPPAADSSAYRMVNIGERECLSIPTHLAGSELLFAKTVVFANDLQEIYVAFPSKKHTFELSAEVTTRFPTVRIFGGSRQVEVTLPEEFANLQGLAKVLIEKGFGEQFQYRWMKTSWRERYYSPLDIVLNPKRIV